MPSSWHELAAVAKSRLPAVLADALGVLPSRVRVTHSKSADLLDVRAAGHSLAVSILGRAAAAPLVSRWQRLRQTAGKQSLPVLLVPFMTAASAEVCAAQGINWIDLSGNANVRAQGLRIHVTGLPDLYARRGRPASVFERRSSRLARVVLQAPGRDWSVRECAHATGLNEGHVSRIVSRLVDDELLVRDQHRRFRVRDAGLLLEAWRDAADFEKHRILRGHIAARSGEDLVKLLTERLGELRLGHSFTGLGAAWLYDHFAMFRLATVFLREWPTPRQLESLQFRDGEAGGNVWLVLPNDDGVFEGSLVVEGVSCVHPVQVYVDLKGQPERAAEASEHLKASKLLLGEQS